MSPIGHSILASSTLSTAKKLKTPLKASVVILTTVILASCGTDSSSKSYYTTPSDIPTTPDAGGDTGATGGNTGATGGNTGATGGNTGATGGNTGVTGGNTGATGGNTGATGGNTGATGGNTGATGGNTGATGGNTGATGGNTGATGGNTGATGGNTGATGGNTGATGGNTGDNFDQIKAELVKAKQEAAEQKAKAEAAQKQADDFKAKFEQAKKELADAEQALEDALASGGGSTEALEKQVASKQKALEEAQAKVTQAEQAAAAAKTAAEAQVAAANKAAQDAQDALAAAQIKNAPEAAKSGVQTLNVNVIPLGQVFKTTTRDFTADSSSVVARADLASGDLLGALTITTSGEGDAAVAGSNGFKAHNDDATVEALGQKLPLSYTSTYKDFGDDMRIGHIDGKAVFSGVELPVNGAAVIGNATKAENMPTEGTVGYTGDATHRKLGIGNAIEFGSSVFTADFVKKALDGKLSFAKAGDINLKANISGNKFSGAADANGGYATEGGFFGGDAQYLGGVYEGNDAQGTYGAKSDKQTAAEKAAADAQAAADAAQKAIATEQAKADAAQKAAADAKAVAEKAQAALVKAQEALANAGNGGDGGLAAALERAEAAEAAQAAAEAAEAAAKTAAETAKVAEQAAKNALVAAQAAADKAVGEAKAEAQKQVDAAKAAEAAAKQEAVTAQAAAAKAKADADKAKADAQIAVKEANDRATKAEAEALTAKNNADAANKLAAAEKAKAEAAQKEAADANTALVAAQEALAEAEQALADALANGGGNTEALQAEVDRRQAALDAANAKVTQAEQAAAAAKTAAEAQVAAANKAAQDAQDALAAAQIKNAPEAAKSGVQTLNVNVSPLNQVFKTTTRDFSADSSSVVARADIASNDLLGALTITTSGEGDSAVAGSNGFKAHNDDATVEALGQKLPLSYTSTYKDFGDDMRIGHIDGKAVFSGVELPVNGAAVIGNATKAENMPTEGTVGYTGDATHRKLGIGNAIEFGSSVFTADFAKKALDGKLSFAKAGNIDLKANISGNKFSGAADANSGYATEGGFFGGDAQYLGGVYEGNDAQGTYGAKSDKQTAAEKAAADAQAAADAAQKAIAIEQAKAEAAQAAADKAKADAEKAQAALVKAQEALANAGNGGDGGLADALEQARLAEEARAAAELVAEQAKIAEQAAKEAEATAKAAQKTAEEALVAAQIAADKAIGDAKAEAQAKVDAALAERDAAKAQADEAITAKEEAEAKVIEADQARDEAILAKEAAEKRAKEAEDALAASQELPPAPANPDVAASTTITGVQSNNIDGNVSKRGDIIKNTTANYGALEVLADQLGTNYATKPVTLTIRNVDTDGKYLNQDNGFKVHTDKAKVTGKDEGVTTYVRDLNYTSVYNNFDEDMQIGHVYGVIDRTLFADGKLSTVYVQGKSTDAADMTYMKELSQYNIDNKINNGKVNYEGVATYMENGKVDGLKLGSSKFDVDFVDQQVDGKLSFANMTDKKVKAEITGNTFAGNWNSLNTQGGFYGKDANLLGGVYSDATGKGTYGAEKVIPPAPVDPVDPTDPTDPTDPSTPVNPDVKPDTEMTGFQSTALSSKEKTLPFGQGQLENAIGYVAIRDDKSDFTETKVENGAEVPIDNSQGNNFTSFDKGVVRGDMVQPKSVIKPIEVNLRSSGQVTVDAGKGGFNPTYKYNSVYESFDQQMQVGHVYGNFDSLAGDVSRATNVYVQGYATNQADIDYLKQVNDGKASYSGTATYIENIHLADNANTAPVKGTSNFDVDFVNNSVKGQLDFAAGNYKYMPTGNKIAIDADITGNTFAGNKNGIDTAGGFYGEDAKFLGGIYQDASVEGGKGTVAGTGTKFQGTFGAEKK